MAAKNTENSLITVTSIHIDLCIDQTDSKINLIIHLIVETTNGAMYVEVTHIQTQNVENNKVNLW